MTPRQSAGRHTHYMSTWHGPAMHADDPQCREGARITCRGHKPERTLKRDDLPLPLGPITSTDRPGGTSNVSSRTNAVPSGAFNATLCSTHIRASAVLPLYDRHTNCEARALHRPVRLPITDAGLHVSCPLKASVQVGRTRWGCHTDQQRSMYGVAFRRGRTGGI